MKPIKEIIKKKPYTCKKDDTLMEICFKMSKCNVGALPVIDDDNKVIGIITDRDVMLGVCKTQRACKDILVHEAMTSEVYTVNIDEDAANVMNLMREKKVGRMIIVDNDEYLNGIISFNSISRNIFKEDIEKEGRENVIDTLKSEKDRNERIEV